MSEATTRAKWRALGTSVELLVTDPMALADARTIVERELAAIDFACSRFRADSELARVNARPGRTVTVDPLLIEAVQVALRAAELTDGDVDPTLGRALELAGYDRDWQSLEQPTGESAPRSTRMNRPTARIRATLRPGWQAVEVDAARATIRVPRAVKLDLGASAKAWAADRAARGVHDRVGCGVLVSLGGDIATAGSCPAGGWRVYATDDHRAGPETPGQMIAIVGGGLATSSTTVRRWRQMGRTMHHILDPSSGQPTVGVWRTVTVAAIDCTDANIAATASLIRGTRAPAWLASLGLPARLVSHDERVLTVGSWPASTTAWPESETTSVSETTS
jgi:thiamine biosynthesis lipoprotein